jgi:glycosyltransferase involved in cell wall biosynthesis
LTDCVTLLGQVSTAEPYYSISDVAVLSSLSEGSPNALLEAMSAGIPAVATRVGGIPEVVVDRESALLVNPGDSGSMAQAIVSLLTDGALAEALRNRAHHIVRERHSPEARIRTLCAIYEDLPQISPRSNILRG